MMLDPDRAARLKKVRNIILSAARVELDRGEITAMELLAVMAHATGACIALQDQFKVTSEAAMDVVIKNLQAGNAEAIAEVSSAGGVPS